MKRSNNPDRDKKRDSDKTLRELLGRFPLIGGALGVWIGALLLFFGPASTSAGLSIHQMAYDAIGAGLFWMAVGAIVLKFFSN